MHSGHVCRSGNWWCCNRVQNSSASGTTVLPVVSTGPKQTYTLQVQHWPSSIARSSSTFVHLLPTSSALVHPLGSPPTHPSATQSKHSFQLIIPTHIPKCMLYGCNSPAWWPLACCYLSSSSSRWSDTAAGDRDPHSCPLMYVSLFLCLQLLLSNQD